MHLTLHARAQKKAESKKYLYRESPVSSPKVSDRALIGLIRSLKRTIHSLHPKSSSKIWEEYTDICIYEERDLITKRNFVQNAIQRIRPNMVWDFGANTGEFSQIAASEGSFTVSIDNDMGCIEQTYITTRNSSQIKNLLPLIMDLANPSPGLGWDHRERASLKKRGPADLILALALVHHLVLSAYVPLEKVARWLAGLGRYLVIEFVPPNDPMVQKLLKNRITGHHPYDFNIFHAAFNRHYEWIEHATLENGRLLFLGRTKFESNKTPMEEETPVS